METGKLLKIVSRHSVLSIVLIAALTRLIPHPPNFAPIAGLALFSGVNFNKNTSYIVPLATMFVSDIFLGFHSTMSFVYVSFIFIVLIGKHLAKKGGIGNIVAASLLSSVIFFIITNFGSWMTSGLYQPSLDGLIEAYVMGLPFFRNTLFGDMFYSLSFFYGYKYICLMIDWLSAKYLPAENK